METHEPLEGIQTQTAKLAKECSSGFARTGNELASIDSSLLDICVHLKSIAESLKSLDNHGISVFPQS